MSVEYCPCGSKATVASGLCTECNEATDSDEEVDRRQDKLKGKPSLETVLACMRVGSRLIQAGKKQLNRLRSSEQKRFSRGTFSAKGWDELKGQITFVTGEHESDRRFVHAVDSGSQDVSVCSRAWYEKEIAWVDSPNSTHAWRCLLPHKPTAMHVLQMLKHVLDFLSTDDEDLNKTVRFVQVKPYTSKLLPESKSELYPHLSRFMLFMYCP